MYGLHIADIIVLLTYFIGITVVGIWAARAVKNMGDFFMPRRFGPIMMLMHVCITASLLRIVH